MKKHLIAAAVAAAVAVPAMAQVTVSGYAEAGYESIDHNTPASKKDLFNGGGVFGSPRIVFSGSEDLGGGLKAGFRLESSIDAVTGRLGADTVSTGTQATTSPLFDRGAEINLSGAFGTVAVGKLDHLGIENNDLNTVGNISLFNGTNVEANGVASDVNGTFRYTTPTFSGIRVHVGFTPKDGTNPVSTASSKAHGGITSYQAEGTLAGLRFRAGGGVVKTRQLGTTTTAATGDTDIMGFAVAYNLGMADVSVAYQTQDNPGTTADVKETILSASVPLAGGLSIRANYSSLDEDGVTAADRKLYTVALVKALSKRSNVFVYHQNTKFGAAATALTSDTSRTGVRVSHSF